MGLFSTSGLLGLVGAVWSRVVSPRWFISDSFCLSSPDKLAQDSFYRYLKCIKQEEGKVHRISSFQLLVVYLCWYLIDQGKLYGNSKTQGVEK